MYKMPPLVPIDSSAVQFTLPYLSAAYTMLESATLDTGAAPIILDTSAIAVYYISQEAINNVFRFSADSFDVTDDKTTDVRYFVDMRAWPADLFINPVNAMLDQLKSREPIISVGIPNKMLVKHDFVRYLALELFNTAQGVDLFNNEHVLIKHLNTLGEKSFQDISATLWTHSTSGSAVLDGVNYIFDASAQSNCTTDHFNSNNNLCRELMQQVLKNNRSRFGNIEDSKDAYGLSAVPIYAGDSISFSLTVFPAPGQNALTGVEPFGGRSYRIKLVVGAGVNTLPAEEDNGLISGVTYVKV